VCNLIALLKTFHLSGPTYAFANSTHKELLSFENLQQDRSLQVQAVCQFTTRSSRLIALLGLKSKPYYKTL